MIKNKEFLNFKCGKVIALYEDSCSERVISQKTGYEPLTKIQENFNISTGNEVSERIVRRALYDLGYHSHIALRKPLVKKYDVSCLTSTVKYGGGRVMMWGCFSWYGLGSLIRIDSKVNSERYINEILGYHLIPYLEEFEEENGKYFFQQDNAPIYTSIKT
ncbi:transposable element Tcb1 transposase [Rhizophagus clarus]|uniref:Transposable element Tcb1 transposase n=1 Tax=Rhizophagus clarus TaxID=94130 RepID=A0A8H3KW57_9GLOM|nr:transposable element Tcb1 transposase [Rhizophagus clarus]